MTVAALTMMHHRQVDQAKRIAGVEESKALQQLKTQQQSMRQQQHLQQQQQQQQQRRRLLRR